MSSGRLRPVEDPRDLLGPRLAALVEPAPPGERRFRVPLARLAAAAEALLERRGRLVALFAAGSPEPSLVAAVAFQGELLALRAPLDGARDYPALSRVSPAALLPELELHDLHGLVAAGRAALPTLVPPDPDRFERRIADPQTFVMPYGPIRSGVFESVQYVIETGGEDVLDLRVRPFFKHRGLEQRFAGLELDHAVHLAERIAGIAAVAHATAFSQAVERALGVEPTRRAQRWRVVHAELERIANHLDVALKLAEDAALAVGVARFGILKEQIQRLRARLCGSRFGRGAIVLGGLGAPPLVAPAAVLAELERFERDLRRDRRLLVATTSFTDRLIGSGRLDPETIEAYSGTGPVARACGVAVDARFERPYGAYVRVGGRIATADDGDAMARAERALRGDRRKPARDQAGVRADRQVPARAARRAAGRHGSRVRLGRGADGRARLLGRGRGGPRADGADQLAVAAELAALRGELPRRRAHRLLVHRAQLRPDPGGGGSVAPCSSGSHADCGPGSSPPGIRAGRRRPRTASAGVSGCWRPTAPRPRSRTSARPARSRSTGAASRSSGGAAHSAVSASPPSPGASRSLEARYETAVAGEGRTALGERTRTLKRSIHVRHVDAGSDGSEEWEIQALTNPYYDMQRLGLFFTLSPRHADILLVTGGVAEPMREPLLRAWEAMPEPKAVVAAGTDACSGGFAAASGGVDRVLPVDVYVPGSPPSPIALLHGLLLAAGILTEEAAA